LGTLSTTAVSILTLPAPALPQSEAIKKQNVTEWVNAGGGKSCKAMELNIHPNEGTYNENLYTLGI
jgi:hypothetical protein